MASCKVRDVAILSFKWGGRRRRRREWWMCCVCVIVYRVPPLLVVELARSRMFLLTRYNASTSSLLWPGNDPRCVAGLLSLSLSLFHSMCIKDDSVLLLLLGRHTNLILRLKVGSLLFPLSSFQTPTLWAGAVGDQIHYRLKIRRNVHPASPSADGFPPRKLKLSQPVDDDGCRVTVYSHSVDFAIGPPAPFDNGARLSQQEKR